MIFILHSSQLSQFCSVSMLCMRFDHMTIMRPPMLSVHVLSNTRRLTIRRAESTSEHLSTLLLDLHVMQAITSPFSRGRCICNLYIYIMFHTHTYMQPEDPQPTASEVIAKAITSGVLSGEGLAASPSTNSPQSKKKKRKKAQRIFSQYTGIPMTISAQNKITPKKTPPRDLNSRRPFR